VRILAVTIQDTTDWARRLDETDAAVNPATLAFPRLSLVAAGFLGPPDKDGTVEIGCSVVQEATGHGYATEALKALLAWASRHGASRVIVHTTRSNVASVAVLRHCGFVEGGPGPEPSRSASRPEVQERSGRAVPR
jgi:RimJ/RimL family protein N-acetyltransferase